MAIVSNTTVRRGKIAIIGCGNVGMRYAYAVAIGGLARELVLVDANRRRTEGEVMDLCHGAPFFAPVDITAGDYADIAGATVVVITAGRKQQPGQTRVDLVRDNVALYREIIPEIVRGAPQAVLLVATNPVDVLAYAAYRFSGKDAATVIGSGTVLDSARLRFLLSRHCQVDARSIHAYILGEHGDTEFPLWSSAMVGGILFKDFCPRCRFYDADRRDSQLQDIFVQVRDAAYRIIERKGETSSAIGLALARITEAIINDENAVLPVSVLLNGLFGLRDVYLSLPAIVNRYGVRDVLPVNFDQAEQQLLSVSAAAIRSVIEAAGIDS